MPSPADRGQPRPRRRDRGSSRGSDDRDSPAGEPGRGRARIETSDASQMLPDVLQDVDECMSDLTRRRERAGMVSVVPDPSPAAERPVDRLCDADGEPLNATAQRPERIGLEQQVHVVALHAEVQQPELSRRRLGERGTYGPEDVVATEGGQAAAGAQRDVDRAPRIVSRPSPVRHPTPAGTRLSSRALAPSAPCRRLRQFQLKRSPLHLE